MTIYGERHLFRWLPCVKGAVAERLRDCFIVTLFFYNPSVTASRATSLYTREALLSYCILRYAQNGGRDALRKYASGIFLAKAGSKLCLRPGPKGKPPPYIYTSSLFTLHFSFFLSSVGSLREGAGAVRRLKENALCYLCANISSAGSFHRYRGPPPSQREANIASI